jgi:hypothetical protein
VQRNIVNLIITLQDGRKLRNRIHFVAFVFIKSTKISREFTLLMLERINKIHTYHSRFIPEGVADVSQIFLRDTHVSPKLVTYEEHCRRDKPIAVLLQSISGVSAINPSRLLRHPWRKKRGAILLFCPGHHTRQIIINKIIKHN